MILYQVQQSITFQKIKLFNSRIYTTFTQNVVKKQFICKIIFKLIIENYYNQSQLFSFSSTTQTQQNIIIIIQNSEQISMKIQAILLSEMNPEKGHSIIEMCPSNCQLLKGDQFNFWSSLILPKQHLCNTKVLSVQFKYDYIMVGMPCLTQGKSYYRAKYFFSITIFVTKANYIIYESIYKEISRKLAYFFKLIEESQRIIYFNKLNKEYFRDLLVNIYDDINKTGQCSLSYQCKFYTFINTNHSPFMRPEYEIKEKRLKNQKELLNMALIPVTNLTKAQVESINTPIGQVLMRHAYNGELSLGKICLQECHPQGNPSYDPKQFGYIKEDDVINFYQIGINLGVVFMVSNFNNYDYFVLKDEFFKYSAKPKPQDVKKFQQMAKNIKRSNLPPHLADNNFTMRQLLFLYMQMDRKNPLHQLIKKNASKFQIIDEVKWVRMGLILGIIVHLQEKIIYALPGDMKLPERLISKKKYLSLVSKEQNELESYKHYEKFNQKFITHLKYMDSINEMCQSLKVSRQILLQISEENNRQIILVQK